MNEIEVFKEKTNKSFSAVSSFKLIALSTLYKQLLLLILFKYNHLKHTIISKL